MRRPSWLTLCGVLTGSLLAVACESLPAHEHEIAIPEQDDWIDCGLIIAEGSEGEWDRFLWGGFALSIVKRSSTYFLYYQGSRAYDEAGGTVAWRSIGVATSPDGLHFTKHEGNPVLTWAPGQNLEEGAVAGAALLDESGRIVIYYGANTWAGGDRVNADVRFARSDDGLHFLDGGVVLAHSDPDVWGSADELFPLIAIRNGAQSLVYYVPNGSLQRGLLGVAAVEGAQLLTSFPVAEETRPIPVWGPGGAAQIGVSTYALFLNDERDHGPVQVRTMTRNEPGRVSKVVAAYEWDEVSVATVLLDEATQRWLLYYRTAAHDAYGVKVAPIRAVGGPQTLAEPPCCSAADLSAPTCG